MSSVFWTATATYFAGGKHGGIAFRARSMILHLAQAIPDAATWFADQSDQQEVRPYPNQKCCGHQAQSDWPLFGGT